MALAKAWAARRYRSPGTSGTSGSAFLFLCCVAAEAAPVPRAFLKTDYASIAQVSVPAPNVLFLLDTGSPIVFSPKSIMPLRTDGYSQWERAFDMFFICFRMSSYERHAPTENIHQSLAA